MLRYFFEIGSDHTLFDSLAISTETDLCNRYQGKFPVISISLKSAEGNTFERAKKKFRSVIGNEAVRFSFLSNNDGLNETERQQFAKLIKLDDVREFAMSDELLENSLLMLSRFLQKHYGRKRLSWLTNMMFRLVGRTGQDFMISLWSYQEFVRECF